jgi:predicted nucleic acid-binding protein
MTILVLDASVAIKWFVPEPDSAIARRLLGSPDRYIAPDLLFAEMTNVIWKKVRQGNLSPEDGPRIIADMLRADIETVPCRDLTAAAFGIALATGRSGYDAMYVALAKQRNTRLITADDRLFNALARAPEIAPHIQALRDY